MSIFSRRGRKFDGIVCRAEHPRFGYGNYAVKNESPDFRTPVRFVEADGDNAGYWEVA